MTAPPSIFLNVFSHLPAGGFVSQKAITCFWTNHYIFLIDPNFFKNSLKWIPNFENASFLGPPSPFWDKQGSFQKKQYGLHLTAGPFHCGKYLWSRSRVMRMHHLGPKMVHSLQTSFFWKKLLILFSSTFWHISL